MENLSLFLYDVSAIDNAKSDRKTVQNFLKLHATKVDSGDNTGHQDMPACLIYQLVHYVEDYNPEVQAEIAAQFGTHRPDTTLSVLNDRNADNLRLRNDTKCG